MQRDGHEPATTMRGLPFTRAVPIEPVPRRIATSL